MLGMKNRRENESLFNLLVKFQNAYKCSARFDTVIEDPNRF